MVREARSVNSEAASGVEPLRFRWSSALKQTGAKASWEPEVYVVPRAGIPGHKARRPEGKRAAREAAWVRGDRYTRLAPGSSALT